MGFGRLWHAFFSGMSRMQVSKLDNFAHQKKHAHDLLQQLGKFFMELRNARNEEWPCFIRLSASQF